MTELFECNLNDEVLVRLTPDGEKFYTENAFVREPENDAHVYSFLIWEFMNLFGDEMYMGNVKQFIVDNKVVFRKET